jgi:Zn-dependent protease
VEGIGLTSVNNEWLKTRIVYPQLGVEAPPFTKPGWIRIVADPAEFANTIGQKMEAIISGTEDVWVPSAEGALAAGLFSLGATSVVSSFATAVSNPGAVSNNGAIQKILDTFPVALKKWLHEFISSKRKLAVTQKHGHPWTLTKLELVAYAVALSILTLAFSYAKAQNLQDILAVLPTVLATSILVEFVKNYAVEAIARQQGVWTEHRLWYFGVATFLVSTIAFKTPFSSPSRNTHYSASFTRRSLGLVSSVSVLVGLFFAVIFYILLANGFGLLGSMGLVMSLTLAFFETVPIPPMNGKDIYDWSKPLWLVLFVTTSTLYMLCILLI